LFIDVFKACVGFDLASDCATTAGHASRQPASIFLRRPDLGPPRLNDRLRTEKCYNYRIAAGPEQTAAHKQPKASRQSDSHELNASDTQRSGKLRNILVTFVALTLGFACAAVELSYRHSSLAESCPADSFIVGGGPASGVGLALAFLAGFLAGNVVAGLALDGLGFPSPRQWRWWTRIKAVAAVIAIVLAFSASEVGMSFCATPAGITVREWPSAATRFYRWEDVRGIKVTCRTAAFGRRPRSRFVVTMSDGKEINLADMPRSFIPGYPALRQVLQGVPLVYDDSELLPSCKSPLRDLPRW
jgi:hypothetical protein